MTVTTGAGLRAAMRAGQQYSYIKTSGISVSSLRWGQLFDRPGTPTGVVAGTSTTAGVVLTDASTGFTAIDSFNGNAGFIAKVDISSSLNTIAASSRLHLNDLLWKSGAHAFNAADTITAPPSYSSRIPGGTDYNGLEIWVEVVSTFTGSPDITITYTNESGTAGRTTGTITPWFAGVVIPTIYQMPLQAGDRGVQKIETVTCATASAGTFNVTVVRPLIKNIRFRGLDTVSLGPELTGCPRIYDDSALYPITMTDNGSTAPAVDMQLVIANG